VALIGLFLLPQPLAAQTICPRPDSPRLCAELFIHDLVLTGKVVSARSLSPDADIYDPGDDGGWISVLKVRKIYRGQLSQTVKIYSDVHWPLDKGKSYLLFADRMDKPGVFLLDGCAPIEEVIKTSPTLLKIEEILRAKPGSGGHIGGGFTPTGDMTDLSGIRITATAKASGKTYEAVTAKDGSWDMWVPAGTYDLQAKSPHWYVSPDDNDSLYPFKNIDIHDGGCADVEFSGMHLMY
jgi:hypothetical protein